MFGGRGLLPDGAHALGALDTHLRFYSTVLRGHIRASSHVLVIAVR
jgi:hypothetical protein